MNVASGVEERFDDRSVTLPGGPMEGGGGFAVSNVDQIGAFAKEAVDLGQVSVLDGFEEGLFHGASLAIYGSGVGRVHEVHAVF
jgi:hypothetical protein